MNDFILVEFLSTFSDHGKLAEKLVMLGEDFEVISIVHEHDMETAGPEKIWFRWSGKMNSQRASIIKLSDPFLSERMQVSYIPDTLKNQYRR